VLWWFIKRYYRDRRWFSMSPLREVSTDWVQATRFLALNVPLEPTLSAVELTDHHDFARRTLEKPQISIK
jgi:hypothetical protein